MATSDHTNNGIPVGIGYDSKDRAKSLMELSAISVTTVSATNYIGVPAVGGVTELSGLGDVCNNVATTGQALTWNGIQWCPSTLVIPDPSALVGIITSIETSTINLSGYISINEPTWTGGGGGGESYFSSLLDVSMAYNTPNGGGVLVNTPGTYFVSTTSSVDPVYLPPETVYTGTNSYLSALVTSIETSTLNTSAYIEQNEGAWGGGGGFVTIPINSYLSSLVTELTASSWEFSGASIFVSAAVGTNTTNIGTNTTNIGTNTTNIGTNTTNIGTNTSNLVELTASSWEFSGELVQNGVQITQNATDIFWLQYSSIGLSAAVSSLQVSAGNFSSCCASTISLSAYISEEEGGWGGGGGQGALAALDTIGTINLSSADRWTDTDGGLTSEVLMTTPAGTNLLFMPSAAWAPSGVGSLLKASGTDVGSVANLTRTVTWANVISHAAVGEVHESYIQVSSAGVYSVDVQVTCSGSNRTELAIYSYIDSGGGFILQQSDTSRNYNMRDIDQNMGTTSLSTAFVLAAGDSLQFQATSNSDGTTVLTTYGTLVKIVYTGPEG